MRTYIQSYKENKDGATAIEAAIVFPILITCLFAVFGLGVFLHGTHQAQRTIDETAREARVMSEPTHDDLVSLLKGNMQDSIIGSYEPAVVMLSQYDGQYAELKINYNFSFDVPFLNLLRLKSSSKTQVKLRELPV